jgi:flagellar assembly factor FliW
MTPDITHDAVLTFAEGLPGFETSRRFVLIQSPTLAPFRLVQALEEHGPSFIALDPHRLDPDYRVALERADLARLQASPDQPLLWLAIVSAPVDAPATVNLRAPLVINPASMRAIQVVPSTPIYRVDHPLPVE